MIRPSESYDLTAYSDVYSYCLRRYYIKSACFSYALKTVLNEEFNYVFKISVKRINKGTVHLNIH